MSERQTRSFVSPLEVRADDGRTIRGRATPYNEVAEIHDYNGSFRERFLPGAFARSIEERGAAGKVRLLAAHNERQFPIGTVKPFEKPDGLYIESRVSQTSLGEDALTLIRDGLVLGLSVGFRAVQESWSPDGVREIREASLLEVSLVAEPAYAGAGVSSVRSALDQLDALALPPITIAAAYTRLYELRS